MKQIFRTACIALASAAIFTSCKKDDDKPATADPKTTFLTNGTWKLVSDQEKIGNEPWQEMIGFYDACELDNFLKFNPTQVVYNDGAVKCDPADQQEYSFPWSFENGGTKLNIDGEVVEIEELSATTLSVVSSDTADGLVFKYRQVFKH